MEEKILKILNDADRSYDVLEIYNRMLENGLVESKEDSPNLLSDLTNELEKMQSEGKIYKTNKDKFILFEKCKDVFAGYIHVSEGGKMFFVTPPDQEDLLIKPVVAEEKKKNKKSNDEVYINGDYVICERLKVREGNHFLGRVIRLLRRNLANQVGTITIDSDGHHGFIPDDKKLGIRIKLDESTTRNLVDGYKVVVTVGNKISGNLYSGAILKVLGHKDDPGVDILSVAAEHNIKLEFDEETMKEAESLPTEVRECDKANRIDETGLLTFTIDGKDSKDFDDAISYKIDEDGNFHLFGHIADVSHYVPVGSALDKEAYERGTSNYLANTVIPMFPHIISNGICSLNEGVVRLTETTEIVYDKTGKRIDSRLYSSFIISDKRMTYEDANKVLMNNEIPKGYENFADTLRIMNDNAKIIQKRRNQKGSLDFQVGEPKILQDENGKAISVTVEERGDAQKMIETFMVEINEVRAEYAEHNDLPYVFRVHEYPTEEKLNTFISMVHALGYPLKINVQNLSPRTVQDIIKQLEKHPDFLVLSQYLLRSMQKAVYSETNIGHFGLASRAYSHTTSPIRRYPDLVDQRIIKAFRDATDAEKYNSLRNMANIIPSLAEHCSQKEQDSVYAERDVDAMKSAEYMEQHIGEEYDGFISSISNHGFFVQLENYIDGFVNAFTLKDDRYFATGDLVRMIGQNTGKTYKIGDRIRVRVLSASKELSTIDFEIVEERDKDGNTKQRG